MTDMNDKPQAGETVPSQVDTTGQPQAGSETNNGMTLEQALAKIAELNRENAKHRNEKKAAESAKDALEKQRLADEKRWEELYKKADEDLRKLQPIAEQHEAITAAFNASLDNRLKQIPEDVRKDMVDPVRAGMSPVDFSNWLDRNLTRLAARQAPGLDGGAGSATTTATPKVTPEVQAAIEVAKEHGFNILPESIAKRVKQQADQRARFPKRDADEGKE